LKTNYGNSEGIGLPKLEQIIFSKSIFYLIPSSAMQAEKSNYTDQEFLKIIDKGKDQLYRGDVFQIVFIPPI